MEFLLNVFGEIINNYKKILNEKNEQILSLERDFAEAKNILNLLSNNRNSPGVFDYWANEAKKYI